MQTNPVSYAQLLETNNLVQIFTDETYWLCVTRTTQESKLFPVPSYMLLSYLNAFYRYPRATRYGSVHTPWSMVVLLTLMPNRQDEDA